MSKTVKIVLALLVFGLLLVSVCVRAGYVYVMANGRKMIADGQREQHEAKLFAHNKSADACLDESLRRLPQARGLMDQAMLQVFLKECLKVALPSEELCVGVPTRREVMRFARWSLELCEKKQMAGSQPCARLVQGLGEYCERHPAPAQ